MRSRMPLSEWKERMRERPEGENSFALALIIEQGTVCQPCRDDEHPNCTKQARDVIAYSKPIACQCMVCNPDGEGIEGIVTSEEPS